MTTHQSPARDIDADGPLSGSDKASPVYLAHNNSRPRMASSSLSPGCPANLSSPTWLPDVPTSPQYPTRAPCLSDEICNAASAIWFDQEPSSSLQEPSQPAQQEPSSPDLSSPDSSSISSRSTSPSPRSGSPSSIEDSSDSTVEQSSLGCSYSDGCG